MIKLHKNMLYLYEHVDFVGNHIQLQIVPSELRNVIFIAFHANPIGSHFDLYHTFHHIRLRYHWSNMYKYISHFISNCAGCRISNARMRKSSPIIYNFPINEPFKVIHAQVYAVGSEQAFKGKKGHMNVLDGMTGYAISEPLLANQMNAAGFSKAIMKILLANGLAHTIVINKDSKFRRLVRDDVIITNQSSHHIWWQPWSTPDRTISHLSQQIIDPLLQRTRLHPNHDRRHPAMLLRMELCPSNGDRPILIPHCHRARILLPH
jgi:hypothetical protein